MIILTNNNNPEIATIIYLEIDSQNTNNEINLTEYINLEKIIIEIEKKDNLFLPLTKNSFYLPSKLNNIKINSQSTIYFRDDVIELLCNKIKIKTLDLSNCLCAIMPDKFCIIDNILLNNFAIDTYLSYENTTHTFGKVKHNIKAKKLICSYLNPTNLFFLRNFTNEIEIIKINFRQYSTTNKDYFYNLNTNNLVDFLDNLPSNLRLLEIHESWNVNIKNIKKIPLNCKIIIFK